MVIPLRMMRFFASVNVYAKTTSTGFSRRVITDELDVMCRRIQRIAQLRGQEPTVEKMIRGIHIEGPFLNEQPGYIGAHPVAAACPADVEKMKHLLDAADGATRIVTLAPERDPDMRVTRYLAEQGIVVFSGTLRSQSGAT